MELGTVRIVGSVVVIIGCFIFLYPKLIHPVILTVFGLGPKERPKANDEFHNMKDKPPVHPGHPHDARGMPDDIRQHMRPGPHPGMRAAAAENARQTKGSSGRGMMGVVLPMYAVGIVVYLVYTLFKVFNKKDKKDKDRDRSRDVSPSHSMSDQRTLTDEEGRVSSKDPIMGAKEMQRELELLANKAMDKNMTENDMRVLQQRLAETEAQMTKILQAMQSVQARVGAEQNQEEKVQQGEEAPMNSSNNQGEEMEEDEKKEEEQGLNASDNSNGSSQDTESYEVIGKSDKEGSADEASPIIETVGPKVGVGLKDLDAVDDDDDYDEEEGGSEADSEGDDILIEDKKESEDDSEVTVRKRITKTGDTDS